MTVQELIDVLSKYDPELNVFVTGYEGGYDQVDIGERLPVQKFAKNYNTEWYYGKYEHAAVLNDEELEKYDIFTGIVIG